MTKLDLQQWVTEALTTENRTWRQAVHTVITAISQNEVLRDAMTLKGGILLALGYGSSRFTTDLDFSNPQRYSAEMSERIIAALKTTLPLTVEALGHDVDCRVQKYKVHPKGPNATFHNLQMTVGYAAKGTNQHRRLRRGQSPATLQIDYNFSESVTGRVECTIDTSASLYTYSQQTLMAEKYRALLQQPLRNRVRRQDLYDLYYLIENYPLSSDEDMRRVAEILMQKCKDRKVPLTKEALRNPEVRKRSKQEYGQLQHEIEGKLPSFDTAYERAQAFFEQLPWD